MEKGFDPTVGCDVKSALLNTPSATGFDTVRLSTYVCRKDAELSWMRE